MDICQIGYDICEFDSLKGLGIDIIGRVHFDNRDRFSISMGSIGKATEPCQQTTKWLLTSDFWLFLEPWHARWYEYEIFIVSCTDSIYDLENERWLFGDMIDHVRIYGSRVAEGLSTFNVGLVYKGRIAWPILVTCLIVSSRWGEDLLTQYAVKTGIEAQTYKSNCTKQLVWNICVPHNDYWVFCRQ